MLKFIDAHDTNITVMVKDYKINYTKRSGNILETLSFKHIEQCV
jgi:hypothetical protein